MGALLLQISETMTYVSAHKYKYNYIYFKPEILLLQINAEMVSSVSVHFSAQFSIHFISAHFHLKASLDFRVAELPHGQVLPSLNKVKTD